MSREQKPSIIFIDEIDSLCSSRSESESESARRIKTEFLVQMNGVGNDMDGVLVLGATNMPWTLDVGMRRRFEKRIYIALPDIFARTKMFEIHLGDTPHNLNSKDFRELAESTEGYSGSDLAQIVREALMMPVRITQYATHFRYVLPNDILYPENAKNTIQYVTPCSPGAIGAFPTTWNDIIGESLVTPLVTKNHFIQSVMNTRPTVGLEDIEQHIEFTEEFGQEG